METFHLADLIDLAAVQEMAEAHYQAAGMPIGILDAIDDSIIVGVGCQDICLKFHRAHPKSLERCRESDRAIKSHVRDGQACHYKCKNGLWDIGMPIVVSGQHLATMFLGHFFYQGETPDRDFFIRQAQEYEFDLDDYLAALDRVPVFTRDKVNDILRYNQALAGFITSLAENALVRRKADEALSRQQYLLQSVIDCADTAIYAKDKAGRYILSNRYHADLFNRTPEDVVGRKDAQFDVLSAHVQEYKKNDAYVWQQNRAVEFEETFPHKDGDHIYLSCKYPLHNAEGNIFAVCGISTDITQRKRIEEELEQRDDHQKRLRQLAAKLATAQDEEQQRIAEGLHDDVAQDLALCSLKLALADREVNPAKAKAIRDEIEELICKTAEKIRSLSFELSSSSLFRIGFKEAIVELCNSMTKRYDVCFTVTGNDQAQMLDNTTAAVLFKAVRELLFNVVKHAGTKEAAVSISCMDNMLKIIVEDRGKGFNHRVDENLINMGKGMGLFGIKERLADLGGKLDIESTPSDRTRVTLKVPIGNFFQSANH